MNSYLTNRKNIPNDIYVSFPANHNKIKKDWEYIQVFEYSNGLKYYIGNHVPIKDIREAVSILKDEFYIVSQFQTPEDYQQYYHYNFEWYIDLNDCHKIWNYYYINKFLIIDILDEYKELF